MDKVSAKDLILEYRQLLISSPEAAEAFVKKHQKNELFFSLVEFRKKLTQNLLEEIPAIIDKILAANADSDPVIQEVLIESAKEKFSAELIEKLGLNANNEH